MGSVSGKGDGHGESIFPVRKWSKVDFSEGGVKCRSGRVVGKSLGWRKPFFKFFGRRGVILGVYSERFDLPHFSSFFVFSVGDESWGKTAKYF